MALSDDPPDSRDLFSTPEQRAAVRDDIHATEERLREAQPQPEPRRNGKASLNGHPAQGEANTDAPPDDHEVRPTEAEDDKRQQYEERAGILQYDAHLPRDEAERLAAEEVYSYPDDPCHNGAASTKADAGPTDADPVAPTPERDGCHEETDPNPPPADGAAQAATATPLPPDPARKPLINLTDEGNARRVVARHGRDLHYSHPQKAWFVWDGRRWARDQTAEVVRRVKETRDEMYRAAEKKLAALRKISDDDQRAAAAAKLAAELKHALKWEDAKRVAACLELARSEPTIPVTPDQLDCDPWALNVLNGTIDLRTGRLREHRREDLISRLAPVVFDCDAECPLWLKFLDRVMNGNRRLIDYLQRVAGYWLTASVREQALWFLYGGGCNGKSTYLGTLLAMMGDYAMQAVSELLMQRSHESHPTERADLFAKRFVATIETDQGKRLAESLMKQMTGGDRMRARGMRQDFFEFPQTWKIALAANHLPAITGTDLAVWRRIRLVPFTETIEEQEKDKDLPDKLKAELPGVLAWAVAGCLAWQRDGLCEPEEVCAATDAYRREQDLLAHFVAERCFVHADAKAKNTALFEAYQTWAADKVTTPYQFRERMRGKGYESKPGHGGAAYWHGIGLGSASHEHEDRGR